MDTVRSNLSDLFRAQPLALGAIGIAIGAGIAAALPATEIEAEYLGETSDTVKAKAAQFAADQADRVTSVAGNVAVAVEKEAATQGLTLEGAKAAAQHITEKVGRVVDASGKSIPPTGQMELSLRPGVGFHRCFCSGKMTLVSQSFFPNT